MATTEEKTEITESFSNLRVNYEVAEDAAALNGNPQCLDYGLPLPEVYKLAVNFYKEKEGKAVHFSYEDKLQLVAFSQQVTHGPFSDAIHKLPPLGALDVVGRDRRVAWQKLGSLPVDQARTGFVELLSRKCPLFSTYIEAHRREKKEQERKCKENEVRKQAEYEQQRLKEIEQQKEQERLEQEEIIKRQIQQALNEQTYEQFRKYSEHQFPGEPEKQGALVKQLQEQHYIQYMQQLKAAQRGETTEIKEGIKQETKDYDSINNEEIKEYEEDALDQLVAANMWTRADIDAFKQSVSQAEGDGVVRVGHGETVTVRVPTHVEGSRLFWEFATDHYDIGFGLYFEYGTPTTDRVSVHISESEDEEGDEIDDELYDEDLQLAGSDLEAGSTSIQGNMDDTRDEEDRVTRLSTQRRSALSELPDVPNEPATPNKAPSPDEQVIIQRGFRRKPLTWSPYDGNRSRLFGPPREKTPEPEKKPQKPDINVKLRRRLIMSSSDVTLGEVIEKKLRGCRKTRLTG